VSLDVAGGTTKHAVYDLKGEEGLVALYLAFFRLRLVTLIWVANLR
jgi:hypothetical protein